MGHSHFRFLLFMICVANGLIRIRMCFYRCPYSFAERMQSFKKGLKRLNVAYSIYFAADSCQVIGY